MNFVRHVVTLLAMVASLPSQQVHMVGPGNIPDISMAIAAAAPGDVILVAPGTYTAFNLPIGVTIRASIPGSVTIDPNTTILFGQVFNIPSGETAHLVGLNLARCNLNQGKVTFDQCTIQWPASALVVSGGSCHLQSCVVMAEDFQQVFPAPAGGLLIMTGSVTAADSFFVGPTAQGTPTGDVGRPGIWLYPGTSFHGSNLDIQSGFGASREAAVHSQSTDVLISDSWLRTAPSTCAINSPGGHFTRCTLVGACAPGTVVSGPLLAVSRPAPITAGQPFALEFAGEPNEFVLVFGSHGVARAPFIELAQDFMLDPITCFPAAALVADASGRVTATWNVPAAPLPLGSQVWLQGVAGVTFPLQTSPVVGGIVQ